LTRGDHVFSNAGVRAFVESGLGTPNIEDALIPLGIVAAELLTGAEKLFVSGPVVEPILASTAMPGVFPPVKIGEHTYIDGGVVDNVPIAPAVEMGATTLYVLDSTSRNQKPRPLNRPIDYLLHAFTLSRSQRLEVERPFYAEKVRLHVIPFEVVDFYVPFASMAYTDKLIDAGYTATTEYLSHLPAAGPAHPPSDQSGADSALI
jgi:NTE family protein